MLFAWMLVFTGTNAQLPQLGKDANAKIIKAITVQQKARLILFV